MLRGRQPLYQLSYFRNGAMSIRPFPLGLEPRLPGACRACDHYTTGQTRIAILAVVHPSSAHETSGPLSRGTRPVALVAPRHEIRPDLLGIKW